MDEPRPRGPRAGAPHRPAARRDRRGRARLRRRSPGTGPGSASSPGRAGGTPRSFPRLAAYVPWALLQQWLVLSYFNTRIRKAVPRSGWAGLPGRAITAGLTGLAFGALHWPNAPLVAVTCVGGCVSGWLFQRDRSRNLFLLRPGARIGGCAARDIDADSDGRRDHGYNAGCHVPPAGRLREGQRVGLVRFLLRYYRRYVWWAALAIVTIPIYGVASAAVVSLIEPVLTDVLLAQHGSRPDLRRSRGRRDRRRGPGRPSGAGLKAMADRAYRGREGAGRRRQPDGGLLHAAAGVRRLPGSRRRRLLGRVRLPAHRPRHHDRHPQRRLPAPAGPGCAVPRRSSERGTGQPGRERRRADAVRAVVEGVRRRPAVGHARPADGAAVLDRPHAGRRSCCSRGPRSCSSWSGTAGGCAGRAGAARSAWRT